MHRQFLQAAKKAKCQSSVRRIKRSKKIASQMLRGVFVSKHTKYMYDRHYYLQSQTIKIHLKYHLTGVT